MHIFPAIDLYQGCAVRLLRGDYQQMTVYSKEPAAVAAEFQEQGAKFLHLVDLEGARSGSWNNPENLAAIRGIARQTDLYIQLGGGIRSLQAIDKYRNAGIDRLILGTAAVTDPGLVRQAIKTFGTESIAVGVDLRNGFVATDGWTKTSALSGEAFCRQMEALGVTTLICTDIAKDGAMEGTNRQLYRSLAERFSPDIIASGGISTLADVDALAAIGLSGAILGKALYTRTIDLAAAIAVSGGKEKP